MINRLTQALGAVCRELLLAEKWLLAPSRRVGHQWLECVVRHGQPMVNMRIKTVRSMAFDLAAPAMADGSFSLAPPRAGALLMDSVLHGLGSGELKYLGVATRGMGMSEAIYRSLDAMRLAGLDPAALNAASFEVKRKGEELRRVAILYFERLRHHQLLDYAEVLQLAIGRIRTDPSCLGEDTVVLFPADMRCHALEAMLRDALPPERKRLLEVDEPITASTPLNRSERHAVGPVARSGDRPQREVDELETRGLPQREVHLLRAVGEGNEIRAALRQCHKEEISLDDVELLHTDRETYVPLVYEVLASLDRKPDATTDDLPVTFAEGLSASYSRPGHLLLGWVEWVRGGFHQSVLVRMIREGLLNVGGDEDGHASFSRLAAVLRGIGIGWGRERYLEKIDRQIAACQTQSKQRRTLKEDEDESRERWIAMAEARLRDLKLIRQLVSRLLSVSPEPGAPPLHVLAAARELVGSLARRMTQLDQFARQRLDEDMRDLEYWLGRHDSEAEIDIWDWLMELPHEARVMGSGPRPGCLHVDSIYSGGHSGRGRTWIVGLDDGRFPGAGLPDPLLLDSERRKLSSQIPTAAGRLEEAFEDFARLLARLRGRVTLSYSCRNVAEDREMFPSSAILSMFRQLAGRPEADQGELVAWLPLPASYAPVDANESLDQSECWLSALCGPQELENPRELVLRHFPHLAQGAHASAERASDRLTMYDGFVQAAGLDLDPCSRTGRVMSAASFEALGTCPLRFFYKYGLNLELPDDMLMDPSRWLDPLAFGSILHTVFEQFMRELIDRGELPKFTRDSNRIRTILAGQIDRYRDEFPLPSEAAFQRQRGELERAAATFLREEERLCCKTDSRPVYLEASLGMKAEGPGTALDTADPVCVELPSGKSLCVQGRIDRIDRVGTGAVQTYAVWDYKSGSSRRYDPVDPFRQGRVMQPLIYVTIVYHRLRDVVSPSAMVKQFGFFFPSDREAGGRLEWSRQKLDGGQQLLDALCQMIRNGAFLATNDHEEDCKYCDFQTICGNVEAVAKASQRKLENAQNKALEPLRILREIVLT